MLAPTNANTARIETVYQSIVWYIHSLRKLNAICSKIRLCKGLSAYCESILWSSWLAEMLKLNGHSIRLMECRLGHWVGSIETRHCLISTSYLSLHVLTWIREFYKGGFCDIASEVLKGRQHIECEALDPLAILGQGSSSHTSFWIIGLTYVQWRS